MKTKIVFVLSFLLCVVGCNQKYAGEESDVPEKPPADAILFLEAPFWLYGDVTSAEVNSVKTVAVGASQKSPMHVRRIKMHVLCALRGGRHPSVQEALRTGYLEFDFLQSSLGLSGETFIGVRPGPILLPLRLSNGRLVPMVENWRPGIEMKWRSALPCVKNELETEETVMFRFLYQLPGADFDAWPISHQAIGLLHDLFGSKANSEALMRLALSSGTAAHIASDVLCQKYHICKPLLQQLAMKERARVHQKTSKEVMMGLANFEHTLSIAATAADWNTLFQLTNAKSKEEVVNTLLLSDSKNVRHVAFKLAAKFTLHQP